MCRYFACVLCVVAVVLAVSGLAQATTLTPYEQAVIASSPVLYYPCNETSGSVAYDYSTGTPSPSNPKNGTYGSSGNTYNTVALGQSLTGQFKGGAIALSGVNAAELGTFGGYSTVSNGYASGLFIPAVVSGMDVGQGDFSIEEWFVPDSSSRNYLFNWQAYCAANSGYSGMQVMVNSVNSNMRIFDSNYQSSGTQNTLCRHQQRVLPDNGHAVRFGCHAHVGCVRGVH